MSSSRERRGGFASPSKHRRVARKAVSFQPAGAAASFKLEQRIAPATFVWSGLGGANNNWSDGTNWVGGVAPAAGSDLDFPAAAANLSNNNDLTPGTLFNSIEIDQSGYDLEGNSIELGSYYFGNYSSGSSIIGLTTTLAGADNSVEASLNATLTLSGDLIGSANLRVAGTGTTEFSGANMLTGATHVTNASQLEISNSNAIEFSSTTVDAGSTILLNAATVNAPAITVSGIGFTTQGAVTTATGVSSTLNAPVTLAGNTMFATAAGTTLHLADVVSESTPGTKLTFEGLGELDVDSGTYTGTTTITNGTLVVGSSLAGPVIVNGGSSALGASPSGATTGPITVNSATLGLSGTAPVLKTTQLSLNASSNYQVTIDGNYPGTVPNAPTAGYSQINAEGGYVTIAPTALLTLHFNPSYTPQPGDSLDLITNTPGILGTFNGYAEGSVITPVPGETFELTYKGGVSGHDLVLNYVPATASVSSSTNPATYGVPFVLTATLTGATGTPPSGTVTFFDGATNLGTATLSQGLASIMVDGLTPGAHPITIHYSGDTDYIAVTSPVIAQVITKAATSTTLVSDTGPASLNQNVTFTAQVNPIAGGTPTGIVSFFDGGAFLGASSLSGGFASFSTSTLGLGSHSITASYAGDSNFIVSASAPVSQTISPEYSSVGIIKFQGPIAYGSTATFAAYVGVASGNNSSVTGTLSFYDGTTFIGMEPYQGQFTTFVTSTLAPGDHSISVKFSGNGQVAPSQSIGLDQVVLQAQTSTTITSSAPVASYGQQVTYTATVGGLAGLPAGGTVQFYEGSTLLGTAAEFGGQASINVIVSSPGTHFIYATFTGTPFALASYSSAIAEQVTKAASAVVAYAQVFPSGVGFPTTIFPVAPGYGVPTGTLTFFENGKKIGQETLVDGMAGIFYVPRSKALNKTFYVTYSGDANFTAGESTQIHITQAFLNGSTGSFHRFVAKHAVARKK